KPKNLNLSGSKGSVQPAKARQAGVGRTLLSAVFGKRALIPDTDVSVVVTQGSVSLRGTVETIHKGMNALGVGKRLRIIVLAMFRVLAGISIFGLFVFAQQPTSAWQEEVRRCAAAQDWTAAMSIVDREIARAPRDMDIRAWRARVLLWSGK